MGEPLCRPAAHRHDQPGAVSELRDERVRHPWRRGGHDDAGVWRPRFVAQAAVAHVHVHGIAKRGEAVACLGRQLRVAFDRDDPRPELCQHCRLIARARAHVEDRGPSLGPRPALIHELEQGRHARHHVRLRDRLAAPDGQGAIVVGVDMLSGRHECLAWHEAHRSQRRRVVDAAGRQLLTDHPLPRRRERRRRPPVGCRCASLSGSRACP